MNLIESDPSRKFLFLRSGLLMLLATVSAMAQSTTPAPVYLWTTLSGRASIGLEDGPAADARFHNPHGLALDLSGNLYVADTGNHTIRKITPAGVVTTLAGTVEQPGSTDGTGGAARFNAPQGVAVDPAGNIYVADTGNHTIRKITPAGVVTTWAGQAGIKGVADGAATAALFDSPDKLTVDTQGNVYLANNGIRKISGGQVRTLAIPATTTDPDGTTLTVNLTRCPAVDAVGQLYFTTSIAGEILRIDAAGVPTVFRNSLYGVYNSGSYYAYKYTADAIFNGVSGNLFKQIVLTAGYIVRENKGVPMQSDGTLDLGHAGNFVAYLGNPIAPRGLVVDPAGKWYYTRASDSAILSPGAVHAGTALPPEGRDGTGPSARLGFVSYQTVDAAGNVWVAESPRRYAYETTTEGELTAPRVRRISPDGTVTTFLQPQFPPGLFSEYEYPAGLAADGSGKVHFMVERTNRSTFKHEVLQFAPDGTLSSLGMTAEGYYVSDLAADSSAQLAAIFNRIRYDWINEDSITVQRRQPDGTWTTLAGGNSREFKDGSGDVARFNNPISLAADRQGNLFVLDTVATGTASPATWDAYIRKISPAGVVTTVGGKLTGSPGSLAVDSKGTIYLTRPDAGTVTQIDANGEEVTIGGKSGKAGSRDGAGDQARFSTPWGIVVDQQDNLYVIDGSGTTVRKGKYLGDTPGIVMPPQSQTVAAGASVQFTVTVSSPTAVTYQWHFNGSPVNGATGNTLSFTARSTDAGDYAVVVTNDLGAVTSSKATLTVSAMPATPPSTPTSAGGGGSIEEWLVLALLTLGLARTIIARRRVRARPCNLFAIRMAGG